jgi:hypothetical protein
MDRADDVDDRVEGADLVKVDFLDRDAMDGGLRLGQSGKHLLRPLLPGARQRRPIDQRVDLGERPMNMVMHGFVGARRDLAVSGVSVLMPDRRRPVRHARRISLR